MRKALVGVAIVCQKSKWKCEVVGTVSLICSFQCSLGMSHVLWCGNGFLGLDDHVGARFRIASVVLRQLSTALQARNSWNAESCRLLVFFSFFYDSARPTWADIPYHLSSAAPFVTEIKIPYLLHICFSGPSRHFLRFIYVRISQIAEMTLSFSVTPFVFLYCISKSSAGFKIGVSRRTSNLSLCIHDVHSILFPLPLPSVRPPFCNV